MSKWPMRCHFRYLRFKTFPMTLRTFQCEVFQVLLSSSKHSGVPEDSNSSLFPSVGLHPHTWPKQGCDRCNQIVDHIAKKLAKFYYKLDFKKYFFTFLATQNLLWKSGHSKRNLSSFNEFGFFFHEKSFAYVQIIFLVSKLAPKKIISL